MFLCRNALQCFEGVVRRADAVRPLGCCTVAWCPVLRFRCGCPRARVRGCACRAARRPGLVQRRTPRLAASRALCWSLGNLWGRQLCCAGKCITRPRNGVTNGTSGLHGSPSRYVMAPHPSPGLWTNPGLPINPGLLDTTADKGLTHTKQPTCRKLCTVWADKPTGLGHFGHDMVGCAPLNGPRAPCPRLLAPTLETYQNYPQQKAPEQNSSLSSSSHWLVPRAQSLLIGSQYFQEHKNFAPRAHCTPGRPLTMIFSEPAISTPAMRSFRCLCEKFSGVVVASRTLRPSLLQTGLAL